MINQVLIEGLIQNGWKDRSAVEIKKTTSGKTVVSFSIISNYGPENKFSSGIVKVQRWANDSELGLFEIMQADDIVVVTGSLTFNSFEGKDGKKVYYQLVNADEVVLNRLESQTETDELPNEPMDDAPKESQFNFDDETEKESSDDQIPF